MILSRIGSSRKQKEVVLVVSITSPINRKRSQQCMGHYWNHGIKRTGLDLPIIRCRWNLSISVGEKIKESYFFASCCSLYVSKSQIISSPFAHLTKAASVTHPRSHRQYTPFMNMAVQSYSDKYGLDFGISFVRSFSPKSSSSKIVIPLSHVCLCAVCFGTCF